MNELELKVDLLKLMELVKDDYVNKGQNYLAVLANTCISCKAAYAAEASPFCTAHSYFAVCVGVLCPLSELDVFEFC